MYGIYDMQNMKSIHIPLPIEWYHKLRDVSETLDTTSTELARSAIISFIKEQEKKIISEAIAEFASEYGGSDIDLDKELEEAGLEVLRNE
jgi:hypothetical protein